MKIKLSEDERSLLFMSSVTCKYCDELLKKYVIKSEFDTNNLTRVDLIHIETTTRKKIGEIKFVPRQK